MRVAIVAGYGQYTITDLAASLAATGNLATYVTGGYPSPTAKRLLSRTSWAPVRRFADREAPLPSNRVTSLWTAELIHQTSRFLLRALGRVSSRTAKRLEALTGAGVLWCFQVSALRVVKRIDTDVVLVRAGFGGPALRALHARHIPVVVDLSIVHPRVLQSLLASNGKEMTLGATLDPFWRAVERDVSAADALLVNSEFVRTTCEAAGVTAMIFVVPTVPDRTAVAVSRPVKIRTGPKLRCVFAGTIEHRKGVGTLLDAMELVDDKIMELMLIGDASFDARLSMRVKESAFEWLRKVGRRRLDELFAESDVLVFPSNAEGSARVIVEAARTGCYIVATPNSGPPPLPGMSLVPAGEPEVLAMKLTEIAKNLEDTRCRGLQNAEFVRREMTLAGYYGSVVEYLARVASSASS